MEGIGNYKAIPGRSLPPDGQIQNNIFVPIQTQAFIYQEEKKDWNIETVLVAKNNYGNT